MNPFNLLSTLSFGQQGERLAQNYLQANGYRILERNWRNRLGEIDMIAQEGTTLCFVEVKCRRQWKGILPEENVTWIKRRKLTRLALAYLQRNPRQSGPIRFDVVSLIFSAEGKPIRYRLIKGAFEAS